MLKPSVSLDIFYTTANRVRWGGEEEGQSLLELTRVPDKTEKGTKHSNLALPAHCPQHIIKNIKAKINFKQVEFVFF